MSIIHLLSLKLYKILMVAEEPNEVCREGILPVSDHPFSHNIILPRDVLNDTCRDFYSMGETETREALVIRREDIENMYFI